MKCLPVTELVKEVFGLTCVLQKTHPPQGIRSTRDPSSELEADSEPLILVVVSIIK